MCSRTFKNGIQWVGLLLLLVTSCNAVATVSTVVTYSVNDLGGGLFQYNLTLDNRNGAVGFNGLNILNGNTVFALDGFSTIGQPPGWGNFPPISDPDPNLVINNLNYFSKTAASNVQAGSFLAGFSFESSTNPNSIVPGNFAVEGITANSAIQVSLGDAVFVSTIPEPEQWAMLMVGTGLLGIQFKRKKLRQSIRDL